VAARSAYYDLSFAEVKRPVNDYKQATTEQPDRHFNCRYYLKCLDTACVGRWESWCCTECNAFEPATPEVVSNNRGQAF
jgi:hypothetical protein